MGRAFYLVSGVGTLPVLHAPFQKIFIAMYLVFLATELRALREEGVWDHFSSGWNCVGVLNICMIALLIFIWIWLYHETKAFAHSFVDGTFLFGIGGHVGGGADDDTGGVADVLETMDDDNFAARLHDTPALLRMFAKLRRATALYDSYFWANNIVTLLSLLKTLDLLRFHKVGNGVGT